MPVSRRTLLAYGAGLSGAAWLPATAKADAQARPPGCWRQQPSLPERLQEIYPALHLGRIHVIGGLRGDAQRVTGASDAHIAYDPLSGGSEMLTPLPEARHHPYAVSHRDRLYLFGGFTSRPGSVNWIMSAETHVYAANAWSRLTPAPGANAEAVATSLGDRIHLVGGRTPRGEANLAYGDHADTARHVVYDPGTDSWSTAAPALSARNSAAGAVIDGLWHVAGGRHVSDGPSDAHEVYDPREDRWRTAAPMPTGSGAGGNAAGVIDGRLYVFGGEYFHAGGRVHAEVWSYDPKADAWQAAAPMPTPRHGLGAVSAYGAIWLVGGARQPGGVATSDRVERFSLAC